MTALTDLDKVRLRVGDTDITDQLLSDDEINDLLSTRNSDIGLASADAAEAIAALFARGFNFASDGQSFNRSERVAHYMDLAAAIRKRAGVVESAATTRVDSYSDDIPYDEILGAPAQGRLRSGYYDPDLPR